MGEFRRHILIFLKKEAVEKRNMMKKYVLIVSLLSMLLKLNADSICAVVNTPGLNSFSSDIVAEPMVSQELV